MRDDYGIKIFNVQNSRRGLIRVKDAYYGSQAGYKTLDIISSPNNQTEFEVVYLETGETDAPNNATTTINRLLFTPQFITTLKQLLQWRTTSNQSALNIIWMAFPFLQKNNSNNFINLLSHIQFTFITTRQSIIFKP